MSQKRPKLTPKQRGELFKKWHGKCWRCGKKIGASEPWEAGHLIAHWLQESDEVAPEHIACNRADAVKQTKASAKTKRIIKQNGMRPDYEKRNDDDMRSAWRRREWGRTEWKPKRSKYNWKLGRYEWDSDDSSSSSEDNAS